MKSDSNGRMAEDELPVPEQFGRLDLACLPADYFQLHPLVEDDEGWQPRLRRFLDIVGAGAGLALAAPLLGGCAALVLVLDGRPVLYVQERVGKKERTFRLLKLRTMVPEAEKQGGSWAGENDPRVTRLGRFLRRFRLDELPQLLNVLAGDMSLVGPRPERPQFVRRLREKLPFYELRFGTRPGLTGWAQVNFRYGASEADAFEKLRFELFHLSRRTLALDLRILLLTIPTVLFGPAKWSGER